MLILFDDGDYNRTQEKVMTIYLLEIMGLGIFLFLVATLWEKQQIGQKEPADREGYRVTLDEEDRIYLLEEALRLTRLRANPSASPRQPLPKATTK
jgi:hypothetical protein